jgi:hypothetical protein
MQPWNLIHVPGNITHPLPGTTVFLIIMGNQLFLNIMGNYLFLIMMVTMFIKNESYLNNETDLSNSNTTKGLVCVGGNIVNGMELW